MKRKLIALLSLMGCVGLFGVMAKNASAALSIDQISQATPLYLQDISNSPHQSCPGGHCSHMSHMSHQSHYSHYSSRY